MQQPWDLPNKKSSKTKLKALIREYEKNDQVREAGICCMRMAHLLKQIGPFVESAQYGQKAVELLRQADDKKELIQALRAACVPFEESVDQQAYLNEALMLSIEIKDRVEEAWTIYRITRVFTPSQSEQKELEGLSEKASVAKYRELEAKARDGHTVEEALSIFEEVGDEMGIATCLVSLGIERKPSDRALFERAISLFEKLGDANSVRRTTMMADTFAPLPQPWDLPLEAESLPILASLIEEHRKSGDREALGLCLSRNAKLCLELGSREQAAKYAEEAIKTLRKNKEATEFCIALDLAARATDEPKKRYKYFKRLAIMSEDVGEMKLMAWAIFHLSTENPNSNRKIEDALELFEDIRDEDGILACRKWMNENPRN